MLIVSGERSYREILYCIHPMFVNQRHDIQVKDVKTDLEV
jgi:hypothetical protein